MILFCKDKQRRDLVLLSADLNGIDYLEVIGDAGCGKQLALTFLNTRGLDLTADNIALSGDTPLTITGVTPRTPQDPLTLNITLGQTGDFSRYTLTLVTSASNPNPPAGFDPQLASVDFSFKAGCPSPVDCLPSDCCPVTLPAPPDIHYLARDYDGFRQAMLDRMAALLPTWDETHAADIGVTMVETLAYAADRLSYMQDAVNTEAYIGTARSRISLRRHARLVDYTVGEGSNARAWVCLTAAPSADGFVFPKKTKIYPLVPGLAASADPASFAASQLIASPGPVFESLEILVLHPEQNQMPFYDWGNAQCCLPAGATEATLAGTFATLQAGRVLIFEEITGPLTNDPADADPMHRCVVRLTSATTGTDPVNGDAITNIAWSAADALPFTLCLSSVTDANHGSIPVTSVSVARGNMVATDQGAWTSGESLGVVPAAPIAPVAGIGCNCVAPPGAAVPRPRYEPTLANQPLTFTFGYDDTAAASTFLAPPPSGGPAPKPQVWLQDSDGEKWQPVEDLLEQNDSFNGFVPEIEWDNTVHLRFGDGTYGASPDPGLAFTANYRTGNGTSGNVGREALAHVLLAGLAVVGVRNPLAAAGGVDPETMLHISQYAPFSFETQLRCVTAADYGAMAATLPGVQQALGTMRWTGSWYTAFVSIDPSAAWTTALQKSVKTSLNGLRMMGTDLVVEQADLVGLNIGLNICVAANYFRGEVYAALWQVLVTGDACAGVTALLSSENFTFGSTVYSSPFIAAAQSVVGVVSVQLTAFARMDSPPPLGTKPPAQLTFGPQEMPCCQNDQNHLDRGLLSITLDGGK